MSFVDVDIPMLGIVFFLIILYVCLLVSVCNYLFMRKFKKTYGIDRFPKGGVLRHLSKAAEDNYYLLQFPYWLVAKKDGTHDNRSRNRQICFQQCTLYLGQYCIALKDPFAMVNYVNYLREHDVTIKMNELEVQKQAHILSEKRKLYDAVSVRSIVSTYEKNPYGFEDFCAQLYNAMGIKAKTTQASNDGGYDLFLQYPDGSMGIVECKCYAFSNSVGRPLIQKLVGANGTVNASHMIFVTTSYFTASAIEYAEQIGVQLINGECLVALVEKHLQQKSFSMQNISSDWKLEPEDLLALLPPDMHAHFSNSRLFS